MNAIRCAPRLPMRPAPCATARRAVAGLAGSPAASRTRTLRVVRASSSAGGSNVSGSSGASSSGNPSQPPVPDNRTPPTTSGGVSRRPLFVYSAGGGGGGEGGAGSGGGPRPVSTGGSGGRGRRPAAPHGWPWTRALLVLLGVSLAVPLWQFVNRRFLFKPEPEHTLAKAEDAAGQAKRTAAANQVGQAADAVKQATVEPVREAVAAGAQAVKHSDAARTVQHKAEDARDAVDVGLYDAARKAERGADKLSKEVRHGYEDAKSKAADVALVADVKSHEAQVKGGRALRRGKEKVSDVAFEAGRTTKSATKSALEGLKGAAATLGRKLHLVADATEKGIKQAADKVEEAVGVKGTGATRAARTADQEAFRKQALAVAGGVAIGMGVLVALYAYDKKGGDLRGKVRKATQATKEAADTAVDKARKVLGRSAHEPAGPPTPPSAPTMPPGGAALPKLPKRP